MKKSKWETRYTITLSDGEKITATGSMLNSMCIAFYETATRQSQLGCEALGKENARIAEEIHNYLESKGYYED